jgi:IclR family transcriptional regulator, acetate operon repressor
MNETGTQAVERAAIILSCLIEGERALSIGELCEATGIKQPTVSRIVAGLERHGVLAKDGQRGLVRPGPLLLRLAASDFAYRHLIVIADSFLREVAAMTHETVNLSVPARGGVNHLVQIDSDQFVGVTNWIGRDAPFHCSSAGKLFLAFGCARLPDGPLKKLTKDTITDRQRLTKELGLIRGRGFARAIDELEIGLSAVTAPIHDPAGTVVAGISLSGPTPRFGPEQLDTYGELLIGIGRRVSSSLAEATPPGSRATGGSS